MDSLTQHPVRTRISGNYPASVPVRANGNVCLPKPGRLAADVSTPTGRDSRGRAHHPGALKLHWRAFTLVELLVVIAILGILAALLLPVLSKGKNQAAKTTDINNLKQLMAAVQVYASEEGDVLPPPNWDDGYGTFAGWLYKPNTFGTNSFAVQTGLLWNTLLNPKLYFCPMDRPASATFQERPQQISSYAMNGAVIGYDFNAYPPVKLSALRPGDCAFWETDENHPEYFNDGANWPGEGVSGRHRNGGIQAAFDGSVGYISLKNWYADVACTNKNRLWCYPGSDDGGGPNGHNQ